MADPLSIAASIAGLLMLATSVSKGYEIVKALKTPPPELSRLSHEIDAIIPILSELSGCTEQGSSESQGWLLRHNFDGAVAGLKASLTDAEKIVHRFKDVNTRKERLKRCRWAFDEQKVAELVTCLQRQKVTLLLALSVVGMKFDRQMKDSLKSMDNNIGNAFMSVQQMQGVMQTVLLQILGQQTELRHQTSTFHQSVQQKINAILLAVPKSDPPSPQRRHVTTENTCGESDNSIATSTSTTYLKYFRYLASWGILEAAWGSLAFFEPPRPSGPRRGYGIRMTYIPPGWLLRMAFHLSLGFAIHPRVNVPFSVSIAAEVPNNAEIFLLALSGDLEGMKRLFRRGKAAATDRWSSGYTLLHCEGGGDSTERPNVPISTIGRRGPSCLMATSVLEFWNVIYHFIARRDWSEKLELTGAISTPINNAQLFSPELFESRIGQQATFEALGYLGTPPPPIVLEKKSWVQLARPAHCFESAEGTFSMADLQTMDLHVKDKAGGTLLHWACYLTSGDLIRFLIEQGLDLNATDSCGRTALHDSCLSGDRRGIYDLLNAGADWTLSDNWGQTPIDVAARCGHRDIWDSVFDSFLRARQQGLRGERATKARRGVEDIDYDTSLLFESLEEPADAATLTLTEENMPNVLVTSQAEKLLHQSSHVLVFLVLLLAAIYFLLKIVECSYSLTLTKDSRAT